MFRAYASAKMIMIILTVVYCFGYALWHDPWTLFPYVAIPLSIFFLVTWLVAPKKSPTPRRSIDETARGDFD